MSDQSEFVLINFDLRSQIRRIIEPVSNAGQLRSRLEEIQNCYHNFLDAPIGVSLVSPSGDSMSIGLGGEGWLLIYTRMVGDEPSEQRCSLGNDSLDVSLPFYFEQWTEMPRKWLIPRGVAEEVVIKWFSNGNFDEIVVWIDTNYWKTIFTNIYYSGSESRLAPG